MAAARFRHTVKLDQVEQGLAFLNIQLEGPLNEATAKTVSLEVSTQVDSLGGRPFGLLVDLRKVTGCDEAGAGVMQNIEIDSAGKGLEVVAHLVKQPELITQARAATLEMNAQKMFGTFDDELQARRFASGVALGTS